MICTQVSTEWIQWPEHGKKGMWSPHSRMWCPHIQFRGNRDTSILTGVHKVQKVQRCTKYKIPNNLCCFISTIKSTMVAQNNKSTKVCKEKTLEKVVSRLFNSIVWGKTRSLVAKPNSTFLLFLFTFCSNNNGEDEDFLWQWLRQGIFYIFRSGVECFIDVFMNVLLFWCFDI